MADSHIDLLQETIYAALDGRIPAGVELRDGQIEVTFDEDTPQQRVYRVLIQPIYSGPGNV